MTSSTRQRLILTLAASMTVAAGTNWGTEAFANSLAMPEPYSSNFGVVKLRNTNGNNYSGTYLNGSASIYGRRNANGKFVGHWIRQDSSSERCEYQINGSYHWGTVVLQFTPTGFSGVYGACDNPPSNNWSGERLTQIVPLPIPLPGSQSIQLDGWWRGDRSGYYSIQSSGSSFQMKGFTDAGVPLNLYEGTIKDRKSVV